MATPWDERFYADLGERVRVHRLAAGLSQADVARSLGLTRASVTNLEAGRQRPLAHQVAVLARLLDVPVAELLPRPDDDAHSIDPVNGLHDDTINLVRSFARRSS